MNSFHTKPPIAGPPPPPLESTHDSSPATEVSAIPDFGSDPTAEASEPIIRRQNQNYCSHRQQYCWRTTQVIEYL